MQSVAATGYHVCGLSDVVVLEGNRNVRDSFQVLYEGNEVQGPSLVVIAIYNSGNTPRLLSDYDQPVRVDFGQATEILSADVYAMEPSA